MPLGSAVVLAVLQSRLAGGHGYVGALRAAIAVPVVALLIGAAIALALRSRTSGTPMRAAEADVNANVSHLSDR